MSNNLLTSSVILKEALRVLHQECNFLSSVNRQYDSNFAKKGAKIGSSLQVKLPNQYTVTTGAIMTAQDTVEETVTIPCATQKHVGMNFTDMDLSLSIEEFSKNFIRPAMSVLAANVEADMFTNVVKDIYNISDQDGTAFTMLSALQGGAILTENLCPLVDRTLMLSPDSMVKAVNSASALFNSASKISNQYVTGLMGSGVNGFDWMQNTHVNPMLTGSAAKTTGYTVNGATQSGSTITIQTGTTTFLKGDIVTFAGCYRVHPETKVSTGKLQTFVVTADSGANATSLAIAPALTISGAKQNCSGYPTNTGAVVKVGAGANEYLQSNLAFHKDAFAFVTADLELPEIKFAARETMDGISMRIVKDYNIINSTHPCRIDILYGYKTIRPQLACRVHADG